MSSKLKNYEGIDEEEYKQERYKEHLNELESMNKKELIDELLSFRLGREFYIFSKIKENMNEDGTIKPEKFILNENKSEYMMIV